MAGSLKLVDSVVGIVADTTNQLVNVAGGGGHAAVSIIVDVIAITGTWTITSRWHAGGSNKIDVATQAGIATIGTRRLPLTADFNATRMAIPAPVEMFYDNTVGGSLTAKVYFVYGD